MYFLHVLRVKYEISEVCIQYDLVLYFFFFITAAVLAYNKDDLDLVIKASRAKSPAQFHGLSDRDMLRHHISTETLKHYVRRVTLGAQETCQIVDVLIEELKGPAGLDENGISLFKSPGKLQFTFCNRQVEGVHKFLNTSFMSFQLNLLPHCAHITNLSSLASL